MSRALAVLVTTVSVVMVANGCSNVVSLAAGPYPPFMESEEVRIIDARGMDRSRVEAILNEHHIIARFDVRVPQGEDFEERLTEQIEKGKTKARTEGGNVLMYTDNSEMIGVIQRDARYAGASDAITMYVMLRRS